MFSNYAFVSLKVVQGEGVDVLSGHPRTKLAVQVLKDNATHSEQLAFLQQILPYRYRTLTCRMLAQKKTSVHDQEVEFRYNF